MALAVLALFCQAAAAQSAGETPPDQEKFDKQSLALRTALAYDPSLESPFKQLLALYRKAKRVEELLAIYRAHVTVQRPDDARGKAVFARFLIELKRPEAGQVIEAATRTHPQDALLAHIHYQYLQRESDPRALDELSRAVGLETHPGRKRLWLDELLPLAVAEDRRDIAARHLEELAASDVNSVENLLNLARRMHESRFHELALKTLGRAERAATSAELKVDIAIAAAQAERALGRHKEAGARLDALLDHVSPDYWRRPEIVSMRVNLLNTDAGRADMLRKARETYRHSPDNEAAALDLAELLTACELRRDALKVLAEAGWKLPASERIEKQILQLYDRLGDERGLEAYLAGRLKRYPDRLDLAYRHVKALFLLGLREQARGQWSRLLTRIGPDGRVERMLDLGRFLRRMSLPGDAAKVLDEVVKALPDRLDVRRELAETLLATGDRQAARRLFTGALSMEAEKENFLDVLQFMIAREFYVEAKSALTRRLKKEGEAFDPMMLLADVLGKMGDQWGGREALDKARALADTNVRYARWLEGAMAFHELFDSLDKFFEDEQARLLAGGTEWTPKSIARFLQFCETAGRTRNHDSIARIIREQMKREGLDSAARLDLQRLLMKTLEKTPGNNIEVQQLLENLARQDPQNTHEYNLRMARLQIQANRPDLARPLLDGIDLKGIGDPMLLANLDKSFLDFGMPDKAIEVLQRLTEVDPTNRANWTRWLATLAALGDESRFRFAVRGLLAGVDRMPLADKTHDLLRSHLVDSYWRSIGALLQEERNGGLGAILVHLDAIERSKNLKDDRLWVLWTRAYVLNRLNRLTARDETIDAFRELAEAREEARTKSAEAGKPAKSPAQAAAIPTPGTKPPAADKKPEAAAPRIEFPDGLALSLKSAIRILREPWDSRDDSPPAPIEAPLPPFEAKWAFDATKGRSVTQVEALSGDAVLVKDSSGHLFKLDAGTGKLLWTVDPSDAASDGRGPRPSKAPPGTVSASPGLHYPGARLAGGQVSYRHGGGYSPSGYNQDQAGWQTPSRCAVGNGGRIFVADGNMLLCLSSKDGALLWRSPVSLDPHGSRSAGTRGLTRICALDGRALVFHAGSGTAAAFDAATGKVLWTRALSGEGDAAVPLNAMNTGASYADGKLLVYGGTCAVLDADSGDVLWSFDGKRVRQIPFDLTSPEEEKLPASTFLSPAPGSSASMRGSTHYHYSSRYSPYGYGSGYHPVFLSHLLSPAAAAQRASMVPQVLERKGRLVAPAVAWAESVNTGSVRFGVLGHGRMLLVSGGQVSVLSLDLPLAARAFTRTGVFLGLVGHKAVFADRGRVHILNLLKGTTATAPADEVMLGARDPAARYTLSGSRIYAAGGKGILCINAYSGRKAFRADWPDAVAPRIEKPTPAAGATGQPAIAQADTSVQSASVNFLPRGITRPGSTFVQPMVNAVHNGVLYACLDGRRLVALETRKEPK